MAEAPILAPRVTVSPTELEEENLPVGEVFNNAPGQGAETKTPDFPPGSKLVGDVSDMGAWNVGRRTEGDASALPPGSRLIGTVEATPAEKASEILRGAEIGAVESASVLGTAIAGARTAAAMTPPVLPVVGPFAKPIAGTAGFVAGATAGYLASENFDQLFPEVSRQDLVPYREGGKTFGESIAAAPFAFAIPVMNANRIGRFLSGIGVAAREYPKSFIASEIMGGATAGAAGGASEAYFPGRGGVRATAEITGGLFTPGRFLASSAGAIKNFASSLATRFSKGSREGRAAEAIVNALEEAGSDVPSIIKALERAPILDAKGNPISVTTAQKTGDMGLTLLENTLARGNAQYGSEIMAQGQDALRAHRALIERLRATGDPDAFFLAAEQEAARHTNLLEGRLEAADRVAAAKIAKIKKDTPEARAEIGQIVRREVERALADGRAHERELWTRLHKASVRTKTVKGQKVLALQEVSPTNTGESFLDIASSMTPERFDLRMPTEVKRIMSRLGVNKEAIQRYAQGKLTQEYLDTGVVPPQYLTRQEGKKIVPIVKKTDIQDLINIRSDLLAFARDAAAKGDVSNAGFYGKLAESVLDDLSSIKNPAYDEARNFSRTLNDYFTRTYAGDMAGVTKKGAEKVPAEILVSRAFGSNNDLTALRMADIEDAVGMMRKQYDDAVAQFGANSRQAIELKPFADTADQNIISIRDAHARVMRLAASKSINAEGRVDPARLQRFVAENKIALDRLGITSDLSDAVKAENAFKAIQTENSVINKNLLQQEAFAQVLKSGNPTRAVSEALNSRNPVKSFEGLVKLAKTGGPDAVEGLKSSIYDYAFTKAGGSAPDGSMSIAAFNKAMFDPIQYGKPSVYNILRTQNAITTQEGKNLQQLIRPMMRIEDAIKTNQITGDVVNGADALTELFLRAAGAKLGASLAPGSTGSLVAASAGSKFLRKQFDKLPTMMTRNIIQEATKDPQLMALLLKRAKTQREKVILARQIHGYVTAAGLNYADMEDEPLPPEELPLVPTRQARKLLQDFPTAQTRGTKKPAAPNVGAPTQGGTALPPLPASPAGPSNSRKMLQSLFPMDTISAMGAE